jgi:UDP-N-acetylglucosamine diphosphorylase/glucosamine-1-phosphate N-acetyltransferase
MSYILFDTEVRNQLLPFTHTRPVADIRCGIMTMRERWELLLNEKTTTITAAHLQEVYPSNAEGNGILINGSIFATKQLVAAVRELKPGEQLISDNLFIAANCMDEEGLSIENRNNKTASYKKITFTDTVFNLNRIWDIFTQNERAINEDFALLTSGKTSMAIPEFVTAIAPENVFIAEGAIVNPCIINASKGPVYIDNKAEIMEGCMLRGPIALGKNAVLKMGAKVYGATTIGEGCKVGGEVSNVVFFANSNKGHDGFLGNAVIGEWCNLGADTNCSNLKNNYDLVKVWDEYENKLINTGMQFCGLMMGDHSKSGINTMFNTGTVVGVSCNVFGSSFPDKFIPSFSWGAAGETLTYDFEKAMETAERMMERRGIELTNAQRKMYQYIFDNK